MGKIAKGVNKIHFTILYGNYCYIFIENFPWKFSPCIWGIPAQVDLTGSLNIFNFFFHVICCRASQKNTAHEVLDSSKKFSGSVSPKITQKTENDIVGRYRFGWNFDSKFYVIKQIFWAMGESGGGFVLKVIRKSKLKRKFNLCQTLFQICVSQHVSVVVRCLHRERNTISSDIVKRTWDRLYRHRFSAVSLSVKGRCQKANAI